MQFTPDELRLIAVAAPVLIRMLRSREERIVSKMYGEFRNGQTEYLAPMAELACVRDQINEINSALIQLERQAN